LNAIRAPRWDLEDYGVLPAIDTNVDAARLEARATGVGDGAPCAVVFWKGAIKMVRSTSRAVLFVLAVYIAAAQSATFEVASIKLTPSAELDAIKRSGRSALFPEQGISISGNRVTVRGLTAATLIRAAYSLRAYQTVAGGPNWVANDFYDIAAKAEGGDALTFDRVRQMLQTLLADRFQLKYHRETKDGIAYALTQNKTGPKLKESAALEYSTSVKAGPGEIQMTISRATTAQLSGRLSTFVGRPVLDNTGLAGVFDIKLQFAPENLEGGSAEPGPEPKEFPSVFTALQEQLGLKLEATRAPVETLVIEQIVHPSAN
jgi:uncharacterized protein (TIGR03435 family)